jgi:hypothetical protein
MGDPVKATCRSGYPGLTFAPGGRLLAEATWTFRPVHPPRLRHVPTPHPKRPGHLSEGPRLTTEAPALKISSRADLFISHFLFCFGIRLPLEGPILFINFPRSPSRPPP